MESPSVLVGAAAAAAVFALPGATATQDGALVPDAIRVSVNGGTVVFTPPAAPVQQSGTVLVPLRGVFEKLGANVQYDGATKTIVAVKGPTTVRLVLGADQADVNGETRALSVPALATQGATLVPLRFVSEALGAQVQWQATERTVLITTEAPVAEPVPGTPGGAFAATAGERRGEVKSAARVPTPGNYRITLSDGSTVEVAPDVPVTQAGRTVALSNVKAGAQVVIRTDPQTNQGIAIAIVTSDNPAAAAPPEALPAPLSPTETLLRRVTFTPLDKTLAPGDTLSVRAEATPGGTARFTLGGPPDAGAATAAIERPMREESPGVYVGTYEVKRGDSLNRAPVRVTFTPPNAQTGVTLAAANAVTTAAGAPNTPVIDTPQEGASVGASMATITGRAAPHATVRVVVAYQGRALLVIGARGTLTRREVTADEKGSWSVANVKLSAPPGVSKLSFTATAVSVDQTGEISAPATVRFRR